MGGWQLVLAFLCLFAVWCWGLPALGRIQPIRQHVDALEDRRIDASAMFYTELESFEPWLDHIEGRSRKESQ